MSGPGLSVLVVDDEALARARLCRLLGECRSPGVRRVAEASQAVAAMDALQRERFDVILLDIHMPGLDGLQFAQHLQGLPAPPSLVFVTADSAHALRAFELSAIDYLTKPVRAERLQEALQKAKRISESAPHQHADFPPHLLLIHDRGRTERVPLDDVLYLKAEQKYLTVRTAARSYILDGSLNALEAQSGGRFIRVHRNAMVAPHAMRALVRGRFDDHDDNPDAWMLQLFGVDELLAVSRRQLAAVRAALADGSAKRDGP